VVLLRSLARGIRIEGEGCHIARMAVHMLAEGERRIDLEVDHILAGEEHRTVVEELVHIVGEEELHMEVVDHIHLADRMEAVGDIRLVDYMEAAVRIVVD